MAFFVERPPFSPRYTDLAHSHFASYRTRGSTRNGEIPRRGICRRWRRRDGREGRVLSERRASFACGIKIRVPRYTVVLRSQTRSSGSFHVRTREARLSASRNPFFSSLLPPRPLSLNVTHVCMAEAATRARTHRRILREIADLWENHPRPSRDRLSRGIDSRWK